VLKVKLLNTNKSQTTTHTSITSAKTVH